MSEEKEVKTPRVSKADQSAIDQAALISTAVAEGLRQAGITPQRTEEDDTREKMTRHVKKLRAASELRKQELDQLREQQRKMPISRRKARALKKPCKGCK